MQQQKRSSDKEDSIAEMRNEEMRKSVMIKTTGNIAASANIVKESVVMGDVSIGE